MEREAKKKEFHHLPYQTTSPPHINSFWPNPYQITYFPLPAHYRLTSLHHTKKGETISIFLYSNKMTSLDYSPNCSPKSQNCRPKCLSPYSPITM